MKRIIVLAIAVSVATCTWAQGTFTIRRPLDGSTVRETVNIRIPKNSIKDGAYIGVYVNGQFLEAALPSIDGEDYVYKLDTQQRKIADGPAKIEIALFVDNNGKPTVVNRSSVNVTIDNHTSIKIPAAGIKLRYKFTPGAEKVYKFSFTQEVSMISQAQAQIGGRPPVISSDETNIRILYATDNAYSTKGGREGLLRLQMLPEKGKDYAMIIPPGETAPKMITSEEMAPLFMRITDVGREVFSNLPIYFGLDGRNGSAPALDYYPILPLPVLPTKPVKPGDVWQATQLFANIKEDKPFEEEKFTMAVPARGELEGVTWFKGMPCAIVKTVISLGQADLKNMKNLNQIKGDASNVKLEGRIWFALDRGAVARMEVELSQETLVDAGAAPSAGGGSGGPSRGGKTGALGGGDGGIAGAGGDMIRPPTRGFFEIRPGYDSDGNFSIFQVGSGSGLVGGGKGGANRGGPSSAGGSAPGGGRQAGGGQFGQRGNANAGGSRKMVMRVRLSYVADLEK